MFIILVCSPWSSDGSGENLSLTFAILIDIELLIETYPHFERWMDKAYFRLLIDPVAKRLMRFVEEKADMDLDEADTKMALLGTLSSQWREYPPNYVLDQVRNLSADEGQDRERIFDYKCLLNRTGTWAALMQLWAWSQAEEDLVMIGCEGLEDSTAANQAAYSQLLNLDHDRDRDNGPQESWKRWYVRFRHEDRQFFASTKLSLLRSTGYIFWDEQRMKRHWTATGRYADEFSDVETETLSQAEASISSEASVDGGASSEEQVLSEAEDSGDAEDFSDADMSSEAEF
jgi:hypothetical protein